MTDQNTSMEYLDYLDDVVTVGNALIREKTKTYGPSWKKRGGVGAFFTMVRPWDRLESIVAGRHRGDIFEAIIAEPEGHDGSALACVRDLRNYLTLIEAEMLARSVFTLAAPGRERLTAPMNFTETFGLTVTPMTGISMMDRIERARDAGYRVHEFHFADVGYRLGVSRPGEQREDVPSRRGFQFSSVLDAWTAAARDFENPGTGPIVPQTNYHPGTPEDGGHHAGLDYMSEEGTRLSGQGLVWACIRACGGVLGDAGILSRSRWQHLNDREQEEIRRKLTPVIAAYVRGAAPTPTLGERSRDAGDPSEGAAARPVAAAPSAVPAELVEKLAAAVRESDFGRYEVEHHQGDHPWEHEIRIKLSH